LAAVPTPFPPELERARAEALGCTRCRLSLTRTQVVYGDGDPGASLLLLGEAPGEDEDKAGCPFQGAAGRVLNLLLREASIERASVWLTNTVLCRPTVGDPARNRAPLQPEVTACVPHLDAQLAVIRPSVIVTLGVIPARRMLGDRVQLEADHGRPLAAGEAIVIPTFHPASLHWRTGRRASAVDDLRRAATLAGMS
jgi:DNA polymerase